VQEEKKKRTRSPGDRVLRGAYSPAGGKNKKRRERDQDLRNKRRHSVVSKIAFLVLTLIPSPLPASTRDWGAIGN